MNTRTVSPHCIHLILVRRRLLTQCTQPATNKLNLYVVGKEHLYKILSVPVNGKCFHLTRFVQKIGMSAQTVDLVIGDV